MNVALRQEQGWRLACVRAPSHESNLKNQNSQVIYHQHKSQKFCRDAHRYRALLDVKDQAEKLKKENAEINLNIEVNSHEE